MTKEINKEGPTILRYEEMKQLLYSEKDPITSQLMSEAFMRVFYRWLSGKGLPVCDFDGRFYMEIMQEFCSNHYLLRKILAGEGEDLAWGPEEDQP